MSNARDKANIPALNFSSTGIDDNATSTAITIDSSEKNWDWKYISDRCFRC